MHVKGVINLHEARYKRRTAFLGLVLLSVAYNLPKTTTYIASNSQKLAGKI